MKVSLGELQKAETEFKAASNEIDAITDRLGDVVKNLEDSWEDAGQQVFYKYYQEWHAHITGISQLLDIIARELTTIQERYQEADGVKENNT